jgi:polar amino acid transport system substrate-binding protein
MIAMYKLLIPLFLFLWPLSAAGSLPNSLAGNVEGMPLRSILTEEQRAFLNAHPVIRVANEWDWPPYDFVENGQPTGFAIDHIKLLAKQLGLTVEFVNGYSWSQLLELFYAKKIDVIPAMYRNAERQEYTAFTKPFSNITLAVVVHSQTSDVRFLGDLAGKKVGLQHSDGFIPGLKDIVPMENMVFFNNYLDALLAVSTGKVDACIGSSLMTFYQVNNQQITNLKVIDYIIQDKNQETNTFLCIGVRKDWSILRDILDVSMFNISDEDRQQLNSRWFHNLLPNEHEQTKKMFLTRKERAYLQQKKKIRICVDPDWLPFGQIDTNGEHRGLGAELVRTMAQRLNIGVELIPTRTWQESVENIKHGRCDMLPVAMDVPSRRTYLDFTTPFLVQPFVVATRVNSPFVQDTADILHKKIGMVTSYAHTEAFRLQYPDLQIVDVHSAADGLQRLHEGEIYGYIDSLATIGYQMQRESLVDIKIAGTLDLDLKLSIATRKNEPMLAGITQKFIDSLEESETRAMFNKWLVITPDPRTDYTLVWQVLGVATLLLLGSYLWNRRLSRLNQELALAHKTLAAQSRELKRVSRIDGLTQLSNRGRIDELFAYEIERCRRFGRIFSIIIMDIDQFKEINDQFGHQAGDQILIELAYLLRSISRKSDSVGRWGGEEFLIICPELAAEKVLLFAEKLRQAIAVHAFPGDARQTCSFGVATYEDGDDNVSLFKRADDALYRAKANGRNRVET